MNRLCEGYEELDKHELAVIERVETGSCNKSRTAGGCLISADQHASTIFNFRKNQK